MVEESTGVRGDFISRLAVASVGDFTDHKVRENCNIKVMRVGTGLELFVN
jgi:hypothetical protein